MVSVKRGFSRGVGGGSRDFCYIRIPLRGSGFQRTKVLLGVWVFMIESSLEDKGYFFDKRVLTQMVKKTYFSLDDGIRNRGGGGGGNIFWF